MQHTCECIGNASPTLPNKRNDAPHIAIPALTGLPMNNNNKLALARLSLTSSCKRTKPRLRRRSIPYSGARCTRSILHPRRRCNAIIPHSPALDAEVYPNSGLCVVSGHNGVDPRLRQPPPHHPPFHRQPSPHSANIILSAKNQTAASKPHLYPPTNRLGHVASHIATIRGYPPAILAPQL